MKICHFVCYLYSILTLVIRTLTALKRFLGAFYIHLKKEKLFFSLCCPHFFVTLPIERSVSVCRRHLWVREESPGSKGYSTSESRSCW